MQLTEAERFPVGKFILSESPVPDGLRESILEIRNFPGELRRVVGPLTEEVLDRKTKPQVWTIRQVVHHLADSHMNAFIRFKLTLTESVPTIKPYNESLFAELPDGKAPVHLSLNLLEALHARWTILLTTLDENDIKRSYYHPENKKEYSLGQVIELYAYHGRHHLAHISQVL